MIARRPTLAANTLSLGLCVLISLLWMRSEFAWEKVYWCRPSGGGWDVLSAQGQLFLRSWESAASTDPRSMPGLHYLSADPAREWGAGSVLLQAWGCVIWARKV